MAWYDFLSFNFFLFSPLSFILPFSNLCFIFGRCSRQTEAHAGNSQKIKRQNILFKLAELLLLLLLVSL